MKYIHSMLWFCLGGTLSLLFINRTVIGANVGNLSTPEGMAIYNLHDRLLDYIIPLGVLAIFFLVISLVQMIKRKK